MKQIELEFTTTIKAEVDDKADTAEIIKEGRKVLDKKFKYRNRKGLVSKDFTGIIIKQCDQ